MRMSDSVDAAGQAAIDAVRADPRSEEAWTQFYQVFRRQVAAAILAIGARHTDVPDLAQEVFMRFLRHSPWKDDWTTLPVRSVVAGYLYRTARNLVVDEYRKRDRQPVVDSAVAPDDVGAAREFDPRAALARLRNRLSEEEIRLLSSLIAGETPQQIGRQMGVSHAGIRKRIERLRARLSRMSDG